MDFENTLSELCRIHTTGLDRKGRTWPVLLAGVLHP